MGRGEAIPEVEGEPVPLPLPLARLGSVETGGGRDRGDTAGPEEVVGGGGTVCFGKTFGTAVDGRAEGGTVFWTAREGAATAAGRGSSTMEA